MPPEAHQTQRRSLPSVNVIIPELNEERHLGQALCMVLYPGSPGLSEEVRALEPSQERTEPEAQRLAAGDPPDETRPAPASRCRASPLPGAGHTRLAPVLRPGVAVVAGQWQGGLSG